MFSRFAFLILICFIFETTNSSRSCPFKCNENQMCLPFNYICNGRADCPFGSDEKVDTCKIIYDVQIANTFFCAYGAEIPINSKCNKILECHDGSDESPNMCMDSEQLTRIIQGSCSRDHMECSRHECISKNKMCDDVIDCPNGRDESVELCMEECNLLKYFQCGNGKCINKNLVCDNKHDCIDGADEFPGLCNETVGWTYKELPRCIEPTEKNLIFNKNTYYHKKNNITFVYANVPVAFRCFGEKVKLVGNEFNVCLNTGEWRFPLPQCIHQSIDYNPYTNGIIGCPMPSYQQYKDKLLIHKCDSEGNCNTPTIPPIHNMDIRYSCKRGYTLMPEELSNKTVKCYNNQWSLGFEEEHPRCVKKCSFKELICHDTLHVVDIQHKGVSVMYNIGTRLLPGTVAGMSCQQGFMTTIDRQLEKTCQENGTWSSNFDEEKVCEPKCGIENVGFSPKGLQLRQHSPWTYAIFWYNPLTREFDYECGGALIRPNVILTAAHCVKGKLASELRVAHAGEVAENITYLNVLKIQINMHHIQQNSEADIALLKFEYNRRIFPLTICLAGFHNKYDGGSPDYGGITGEVSSWNTEKLNPDGKLNFTINVFDAASISTSPFLIKSERNMLCKGDGGSGFISHCYSNGIKQHGVFCLYGVVSQSANGAVSNAFCSNEIQVANTVHSVNIDFISATIREWSNMCEYI